MPILEQFDAVIVGAGQCGVPLARALAAAGQATALIERAHVGGTCINEGCTPTKTMVASARVAYLARRAADYGVRTGPIALDMAAVRSRKRKIVDSFRSGSERQLAETKGVAVIDGEARFTAPHSLTVTAKGNVRNLSASSIIIDAGGRPAVPPLPGLDRTPFLDSTSIMELESVPEHLVVLGGAYIALEFAQMFRRFGSRVTVVERGPRLMSREDADVSDAVKTILEQDGLTVRLGASAVSVAGETGHIDLTIRTHADDEVVTGSHLLVAVGRTPNTDRLDPAAAGVTVDSRGYIPVDDRLQTNVAGIYAVGDINGGPAFTHISYDDFRILKSILIDNKPASTAGRLVPYVLYIDPQLGRVGLTEAEARGKGLDIQVAKMPMEYVARALETDESRGFMKAIIERSTGKILGCSILGLEGGEIMSALQMAMIGGVPYTTLRDTVIAHPTLMESLNNLFADVQ